MYLEYWGLKKHPFNNVPDPDMYFSMHQSVESAVAELLFAVEEGDDCLAVVTGDVGVGKTMCLRIALDSLNADKYRIAFVTNPDLSFPQLLREVVGQLEDKACEEHKKDKLLERFNKILFETNDQGKRVVIFIDEGNVIKPANLDSLRLLTNMQDDKHNLFTIILAGQPELARRLEDPRRANLFQRIGVYCKMSALESPEVMKDYIEHRLERAGIPARVFTDDAYSMIWRCSGPGIPRLVNKLCKLAMKAGETNRLKEISGEVIAAVAEHFLKAAEIKKRSSRKEATPVHKETGEEKSVPVPPKAKDEHKSLEEMASHMATEELRHSGKEIQDPYEAWVARRREILAKLQAGERVESQTVAR